MKNIPLFTTQNGAASLVLRQIPYRGSAFIKIHTSEEPDALLQECASFCRAAGAENIYFTGYDASHKYPVFTSVVQMACLKDVLPDTDAVLQLVQEGTLESWRALYNQKMNLLANASYMTCEDAKDVLQNGNGYFVYRKDVLLGIGVIGENSISAVASVCPGGGRDVVLALSREIMADTVFLEVASNNAKAVRLYSSLGFVQVREMEKWYQFKL